MSTRTRMSKKRSM